MEDQFIEYVAKVNQYLLLAEKILEPDQPEDAAPLSIIDFIETSTAMKPDIDAAMDVVFHNHTQITKLRGKFGLAYLTDSREQFRMDLPNVRISKDKFNKIFKDYADRVSAREYYATLRFHHASWQQYKNNHRVKTLRFTKKPILTWDNAALSTLYQREMQLFAESEAIKYNLLIQKASRKARELAKDVEPLTEEDLVPPPTD